MGVVNKAINGSRFIFGDEFLGVPSNATQRPARAAGRPHELLVDGRSALRSSLRIESDPITSARDFSSRLSTYKRPRIVVSKVDPSSTG